MHSQETSTKPCRLNRAGKKENEKIRWDKGGDGSAISNVGLLPSGCGKRSSKRGTAKLRKNCDAHTYKRRPVNSTEPLPPRRARFQSVSSLPFLSSFSSRAIRGAYKAPRPYARMSQDVTPAQGVDFCVKANSMGKQENWDSIILRWLEFPSLSKQKVMRQSLLQKIKVTVISMLVYVASRKLNKVGKRKRTW